MTGPYSGDSPLRTTGSRIAPGHLSREIGLDLLMLAWQKRSLIFTTTSMELRKRYSGAVLGSIWIVLYPVLFLGIYMFVYLLVFRISAPGKTGLHYVLYIFSGLVPFLAFMEIFSASCGAIKQNVSVIRNVILPIEFLPLRTVCMGMVGQFVGLTMVLLLAAGVGTVTRQLLWLPMVIILQMLMFAGIALFMSALGVAIPDVGYVSGIVSIALLLVSPIAYTREMVPETARFVTLMNPFTYMLDMFRATIVDGIHPPLTVAAVYVGLCLGSFVLGNAAFRRFKSTIDDHV